MSYNFSGMEKNERIIVACTNDGTGYTWWIDRTPQPVAVQPEQAYLNRVTTAAALATAVQNALPTIA